MIRLYTEYFEGEWHVPKADGPEPWAVVTYAYEPSPETGHVGWCWWALGDMGDATTYDEARQKAESTDSRSQMKQLELRGQKHLNRKEVIR